MADEEMVLGAPRSAEADEHLHATMAEIDAAERPVRFLPGSHMTLDSARSRLSGWHFSQESLTDGERAILHVAEAVLRELDHRAGGYAR